MLQGNGINECITALTVLTRRNRLEREHWRSLLNRLQRRWIHHITERAVTEARQRMKRALLVNWH
jgi:hypothetical protein